MTLLDIVNKDTVNILHVNLIDMRVCHIEDVLFQVKDRDT